MNTKQAKRTIIGAAAALGLATAAADLAEAAPGSDGQTRLVTRLAELPDDVRKAVAPHVGRGQVLEIEESRAHGVTEVGVRYLAGGRLHLVVWDATKRKLLGGSDPKVVATILGGLPESARAAIEAARAGARIHRIKIKHVDADDREYVHVHFHEADGQLRDVKLELDGRPLVKS